MFALQLISDRRALHQIPELELELPQTTAYLRNALAGLGCQLSSPIPSSLAAFFDFGQPETLAFRADCDALPVQEQTNHDFPSRHPGRMHACGHDGHMAIGLELARRISGISRLPHNILILFQPGEESPGGARPICESGILEQHHIKAIFGLHLWPELEKGVVFSRKEEMMARASEVNVDIYGQSAHIGRSWEGRDALAAAVSFYAQAAALEQSLPENVYRLLKFGMLTSGTARNAISDHSRLAGSLRAYQDEVFDHLAQGLQAISETLQAQTGCPVHITMSDGYPAILNPAGLYQRVLEVAPFRPLEDPSLAAEDFAFYQRRVPGMFFFLGLGHCPALHSPNFDFDESVLAVGADFFEGLARNFAFSREELEPECL